MHYQKVGSGPPLLLIHGLVAYSFSWRCNLPVLGSDFTCYAVDLLGMGDSERPKGIDVSPRAIADSLVAFMREQSSEALECDRNLAWWRGGDVGGAAGATRLEFRWAAWCWWRRSIRGRAMEE